MRLDDATKAQVDAAEPRASTWLSANAGSGKTRVLTERVARLLLRGVLPQNILCLTYTRAAAAEMQNRLFRTLGGWSMMTEEKLRHALARIGETDAVDGETARTLFARAVETPGGLRIQTIHSFCASVLRQFPLEAGVPPGFREIEEREADDFVREVASEMAAARHPAFVGLLHHVSSTTFEALMSDIARARAAFAEMPDDDDISIALGIAPATDPETILDTLFGHLRGQWWQDMLEALPDDIKTVREAREVLAQIDVERPSDACTAILERQFLVQSDLSSKAGKWPTKKARKALAPWLDRIDALCDAVAQHRSHRDAIACREASVALHAFAAELLTRYRAAKARAGVLDFQDLIERVAELLENPSREWVRFRLDNRIDHIVVDEAQDTSPDQWRVIEALVGEMLSGQDAARPRSIFVVGDRKQSIYSFQGADARAFDRMANRFGERLKDAPAPLRRRRMDHSFRSSPAILAAVDAVLEELGPGLRPEAPHSAFFDGLPGRVDLWPAVDPAEEDDAAAWYDPVDRPGEEAAQIRLADMVAGEIARLIESENIPLPGGGARPVAPRDILVLVQSRGPVFDRIIATCQARGVDVAGPDRIDILAHLAVKDILSVLRFIALPEDDLALAEALRSPTFGLSEEELHALAAGRRGRLWPVLRSQANKYGEVVACLSRLRDSADVLRPHDLIEKLLVEEGARARLVGRLGPEAEDAIDELLNLALDFEKQAVPDLTTFLAQIEGVEMSFSRASDAASDRVRVMTVHGAKGLEAPIVILPDTIRMPKPRNRGFFEADSGVTLATMRAPHVPAAQTAAVTATKAADREEAERLLYVAMTRAETWLIVCGAKLKREGGFWYQTIQEAFDKADGTEPIETPAGPGLRLSHGSWPERTDAAPARKLPEAGDLLEFAPLDPPPALLAGIVPSQLAGEKSLRRERTHGAPDRDMALAEGSLIHLLLQHLSDLPPGARADAARILVTGQEPELARRATEIAIDVLDHHPDLADTAWQKEVALAGRFAGSRFDGAIDFLKVTQGRVIILDIKTNADAPDTPDGVPSGILAQMGAYVAAAYAIFPDHTVEAELLWTATMTRMALPHAIVRSAFEASTTC